MEIIADLIPPLIEPQKRGPCNICGNSFHHISECNLIQITNHVRDRQVPSKAKLTLPDSLQLQILTDGSYSIITKQSIQRGTIFGPYQAPKVGGLDPDINFPLKIFPNGDTANLEYYLDTRNENECSWLIFINPADYLEEQNLVCYQDGDEIYYISFKNIPKGFALRVWYSPFYGKKMNKESLQYKPVIIKEEDPLKNIDINSLIREQQQIEDKSNWICKFCNQIENTVVTFSNHLLMHYTSQLQKTCKICNQKFNTKNNLNKHIKIVHNSDVQPANQPSDNTITSVGGPLLNDLFMDSSELQPQVNFDMELDNHLLDSDDNLNLENLFGENDQDLDYFNIEEVNDNRKQFTCDVCLKQFGKIQLIIAHLRGHTGDYICTKCLKVFCRKENLKAHICNQQYRFNCDICDKSFGLRKSLYRHFIQAHSLKFSCERCEKRYVSEKDLKDHNCSQVPDSKKEKFSCSLCGKIFLRLSYLRRHQKLHLIRQKNKSGRGTICEICGTVLETKNSYRLHIKRHQERKYNCDKCDKKFYRLDTLRNHKRTHKNDNNDKNTKFFCPQCSSSFKTRKVLSGHLKTVHGKPKEFRCNLCDETFNNRRNLINHKKTNHADGEKLEKDDSVLECYTCPVCNKMMKLRSSLMRHLKKTHSTDIAIFDKNVIKPMSVPIPHPSKTKYLDENNKIDEDKIQKEIENHIEKITARKKAKQDLGDNLLNKPEMEKNSGVRPVECALCKKITSSRKSLSRHLKQVHNIGLKNFKKPEATKSIEIKQHIIIHKTSDSLLPEITPKSVIEKPKTAKEVCLSIPDLTESDQEITLDKDAYILDNGTIVQPQGDSENVVIYVLDPAFS